MPTGGVGAGTGRSAASRGEGVAKDNAKGMETFPRARSRALVYHAAAAVAIAFFLSRLALGPVGSTCRPRINRCWPRR
jgi:hypothetical protein